METISNIYRVAGHDFRVVADEDSRCWRSLEWHYLPFRIDGDHQAATVLDLHVGRGAPPAHERSTWSLIFEDTTAGSNQMGLRAYRNGDGRYVFEMEQPRSSGPNGWLTVNEDLRSASLAVDEDNPTIPLWKAEASMTSGVMLAYLLATGNTTTLMSHASAVLHRGRAFLFIGKSGTGKSTHSRLWLKHIPDTELLNDDHPIVRVHEGVITVYGSPWSGKTHCYKNLEAPLGAIVRLRQAPFNEIRRLGVAESYASLSSSFSGITWIDTLADVRHLALEAVIERCRCYRLDCLPDEAAARLCENETNTE